MHLKPSSVLCVHACVRVQGRMCVYMCEAVKSSFSLFVAPREEGSPHLLPAWKRELSSLKGPGAERPLGGRVRAQHSGGCCAGRGEWPCYSCVCMCDIVQGPHPLWGTSAHLSAADNLLPPAAVSPEALGSGDTWSRSAFQAQVSTAGLAPTALLQPRGSGPHGEQE